MPFPRSTTSGDKLASEISESNVSPHQDESPVTPSMSLCAAIRGGFEFVIDSAASDEAAPTKQVYAITGFSVCPAGLSVGRRLG